MNYHPKGIYRPTPKSFTVHVVNILSTIAESPFNVAGLITNMEFFISSSWNTITDPREKPLCLSDQVSLIENFFSCLGHP